MTNANRSQVVRVTGLLLAVCVLQAQERPRTAKGVGHPALADAVVVTAGTPVAEGEPGRFEPTALDPATKFQTYTAEDGTRFLLVRYRADGAEGIRLLLRRFSLPDDARVFVYDSQGRGEMAVYGPFTKLGPNGDGEFWTPAISGPEAVLELQFGSLDIADLPFAVAQMEVLPAERLAELQLAEQALRLERENDEKAQAKGAPERRRSYFRGVVLEHAVVGNRAVFEGDIILGTADELVDAGEGKPATPDKSGLVISGANYRWPGGVVPYTVDPSIPDQNRITTAIAHWNQQLAGFVRLVPRTTENDYVTIVRVPSGCSAFVGKVGGAQSVYISDACSTGNVIHEIGHAVGLWHEQGREDRDTKVKILWANISPAASFNFDQQITDGDDVGAYDYGSIMHYGAYAFSINGQPTIETIPPGIPIGQRDGLSAGDIATVQAIYPASVPAPPAPPSDRNVAILSNPAGLTLDVNGWATVTPFTYTFKQGTAHTLRVPQQTLNGVNYTFTAWSDGNTDNPRYIFVGSADLSFTANYAASAPPRTLTVATAPAGLQVSMNGVAAAAPYSRTFPDGTQVALSVAASQTWNGVAYNFTGWSDGAAQASRTVTLTANLSLTANYAPAPPPAPAGPADRRVTILSNPPGLTLSVNGWNTVTPFTYTFKEGTAHTLRVPPQTVNGTTFTFTNWSDGNTETTRYFFVGSTDLTFTAIYTASVTPPPQPQPTPPTPATSRTLTLTTAPLGLRVSVNGNPVTTPYAGSFADGSPVTVSVAASQALNGLTYNFTGWGDGWGQTTRTVTMSADAALRANYAVVVPPLSTTERRVTIQSNPPGLQVSLNGWVAATPFSVNLREGTAHTLRVANQTVAGVAYNFTGWADGDTQNPRYFFVGTADLTFTASFSGGGTAPPPPTTPPPAPAPAVRSVSFDTNPSGLRLTVDGQPVTAPYTASWADGTSHTVSASSQTANGTNYNFSAWSDGTQSATRTIIVSSATVAYRANFAAQTSTTTPVTLTTNPSGRGLSLDGQAIATPFLASWAPGTARQVAAPDQQAAPGSRFRFSSWSDGVAASSRSVAANTAPVALTANFVLEHQVTAAAGVTISPTLPGGFYPDNTTVTVTAQVPPGSCFLGWTGLTSTSPVATVTINRPLAISPQFSAGASQVTPLALPTAWNGGQATFAVTSGGCAVTATSNVWWARVLSVSPTQVTFWIDQNRDGWTRSGVLTVGGVAFPFTQGGYGVE